MKSAVETLSPTRVRLTVEVPFDELQPSLDAAYKSIASQVRVPGFRPGKVPPRIIDQRFGRAVVLEQAVNDALPGLYSSAVTENEVAALGQPDVDVTEFSDGTDLKFTAEVDIRPEVVLPDYSDLEVTVDDVVVTDDEVDEHLDSLRERFATLTGADRPAGSGDYVALDLAASENGVPIEDATASGLSYEVGSDTMLDGLDEAVTGLSAGESTSFTSTLAGGERAGSEVEVAVTVASVKVKELPALDDEFAQMASEFDTVDELKADVRTRLERQKRMQQGGEARDKVLEALLERVEVPLPESVVAQEVDFRRQSMQQQLDQAGLTLEGYLSSEEMTEDDFNAELDSTAREAVQAQFVLDAVAKEQQIGVGEGELSEHIVRSAQRYGVSPDQFAQQVVQSNQVQALVGEVVRGKALAHVLESAKVTDSSGNVIDLKALEEEAAAAAGGTTVATDETSSEEGASDEVASDEATPAGDEVVAPDDETAAVPAGDAEDATR